jgi:hypothetical protein
VKRKAKQREAMRRGLRDWRRHHEREAELLRRIEGDQ